MSDDPPVSGLQELLAEIEAGTLPPVDQWNPEHCGNSGMRIARDGTWFHEGSPIGRREMVRLFSSVLRREPDGSHVLVTPAEKLTIDVEDAPFVAIGLESEGSGRSRRLGFRLNTGEAVIAGADRMLRIEPGEDGPRPYLSVRGGLDALVARPVYYELVDLALGEGGDPPGLWSDGVFFPFGGTR